MFAINGVIAANRRMIGFIEAWIDRHGIFLSARVNERKAAGFHP
jgi:hypothetical protein